MSEVIVVNDQEDLTESEKAIVELISALLVESILTESKGGTQLLDDCSLV